MRTSVVVPVHRNAETLRPLADRLACALSGPWRLRLVVDACPEGSAGVAEQLAAEDSRVSATYLTRNVGQHRALVTGLVQEDVADAWVCMDADLQDPPEAVPLLLAQLAGSTARGVFAGRRGSYESPLRLLTGGLHRRALAALTGVPVDAGAFFAMDARLRAAVISGVAHRGAPSVVAAAARSGLELRSVPVRRDVRPSGTSSWSSRDRLRQSARTLAWATRARTQEVAR